jgi:hypothetical protein
MRTKTLALSTLLGMLGSASLMAQSTNVYSLNAVGYINVTMVPGFSMVTCPLACSPNNTLATLFNNSAGQYQSNGNSVVYAFTGGTYSGSDLAGYNAAPGPSANGWAAGGTITINPGQAVFFYNPGNVNEYATFVGQVPQMGATNSAYPLASQTATGLTNTLAAGYSMVGSIVPVSGDLVISNVTVINGVTYSNNITTNFFGDLTDGPPTAPNGGDFIYTFDTGPQAFNQVVFQPLASGGWVNGPGTANPVAGTGDPMVTNVFEGFFYYNGSGAPETWVEKFVINP